MIHKNVGILPQNYKNRMTLLKMMSQLYFINNKTYVYYSDSKYFSIIKETHYPSYKDKMATK